MRKSPVGRKKLKANEKKIPVQVYVRGAHVKIIGSIDVARKIALHAVESAKMVG